VTSSGERKKQGVEGITTGLRKKGKQHKNKAGEYEKKGVNKIGKRSRKSRVRVTD